MCLVLFAKYSTAETLDYQGWYDIYATQDLKSGCQIEYHPGVKVFTLSDSVSSFRTDMRIALKKKMSNGFVLEAGIGNLLSLKNLKMNRNEVRPWLAVTIPVLKFGKWNLSDKAIYEDRIFFTPDQSTTNNLRLRNSVVCKFLPVESYPLYITGIFEPLLSAMEYQNLSLDQLRYSMGVGNQLVGKWSYEMTMNYISYSTTYYTPVRDNALVFRLKLKTTLNNQ